MNIYIDLIICFTIIYILEYFLIIKKYAVYNKNKEIKELKYLTSVYKIKVTEDNYKKLLQSFSLTNSLIMTITYIIVFYLIKNIFWQISIGIVLLLLLIIIGYGILGKIFEERRKNNV